MLNIRKLFFSTALIGVLTAALTFGTVVGCSQEGAKVESKEDALKKLQTLSNEDQVKEKPAK